MVDDLIKCIEHGVPLNRCRIYWPKYLRYLGYPCVKKDEKCR